MNKCYRNVWNDATQSWMAVPETAKGRGKRSARALIASLPLSRILGVGPFALGGKVQVAGVSLVALLTGFAGMGAGPALANTVTLSGTCTSANGSSVGNEASQGSSSSTVDGSGNLSVVAGCSATGNNQLGVTAYGSFSTVTGTGGVAIGYNAQSVKWGTALGLDSFAAAMGGTALGFSAIASGNNSVSIGSAGGDGTTALSVANSTTASGAGAVAIGANATKGAQAASSNSIALGGQSSVDANSGAAIATGLSSKVTYGANAIAIGNGAQVNGASGTANVSDDAIAIGHSATVSSAAARSVVVGVSASSTAGDGVAVGNLAAASNDQAVAVGKGSAASGQYTVALGGGSTATKQGALAVGSASQATGNYSISFGWNTAASGQGAVALGNGSKALDTQTVAIGDHATVNTGGLNSIAIGTTATVSANVTNALAIGSSSSAQATGSIAFGRNTSAGSGDAIAIGSSTSVDINSPSAIAAGRSSKVTYATNAIAFGNDAQVNGAAGSLSTRSMAIGNSAIVSAGATDAIAQGTDASAQSTESVAIGKGATAKGGKSVSIGSGNTANGDGAVAIGDPNSAGTASVAMGRDNNANATNGLAGAVALGDTNNAAGVGAVALGSGNTASGTGAVALGSGSTASGAGAMAIGQTATASVANALALGSSAVANNANDVALGSGSVTTGSNPTSGATIAGTSYTFAGTSPSSVVSVGAAGSERQITNVAAGRVNATSTDAINGSQLYATNQAVGVVNGRVTNLGNTVAGVLGGNATYNTTTGAVTMTNVGGTGQNTVNDAISTVAATANKGWNVTTANTGTGTVSGTSVANVAPGATQTVTAGNNIAITQSGTGLTLATNPDLVSTSITTGNSKLDTNGLAITGGPSVLASGIDAASTRITNVAAGTAATDAVNLSQLTTATSGVTAAGMNFAGDSGADTHRDLGQTLNVKGGATGTLTNGNIGVVSNGTDTLTVELAKDVNLGATGSLTTGNTVVNDNGLTITGGPSVTTTGINAGGSAITNVGAGVNGTDAVNMNQLNAVNTTASKGWNVTTGNTGTGTVSGTSVANVAPGATQTVTAGNNIAITQSGTDLTIATNPDLVSTSLTTGNSRLDTTGLTITGGPNGTVALTGSGLDNGGNKVLNVAAGTIGAASTDAVNGSQLYALGSSSAAVLGGNATYNTTTGQVTMTNVGGTGQDNVNDAIASVATTAGKGWNVTTAATGTGSASGTSVANVAPGDTATITAGNNIIATQNGKDVALAVNPALTGLTSIALTSGPSITTGGINMGGTQITNVAAGTAAADAVNLSQLNNATSSVTAAGMNFAGDSGANAHRDLGQTLNVNGGATGTLTDNNIGVVSNGSDTLTVKLAKDVDLGATGSLTTGNTVVNDNGLTITGGPSVTTTGINAGGSAITNVGAGVNGTDAVNMNQLNAVSTTASKGWNVTTGSTGTGTVSGTSVANVAPGATQTVTAGNNIAITQSGTDLTIATNPDLVSTSITTGNSKLDTNGLTITGGPSVLASGIDAANTKIVNVAAGTLSSTSTDAVNGSQLFATNEIITNINNGGGIKYFHANSTLADSTASGTNSVAIGPTAVASGGETVAMGHGASAGAGGSIAIGNNASAPVGLSVAIGQLAQAGTDGVAGGTAVGYNAQAGGWGTALGTGSQAGNEGVAIGDTALAGVNSVALGANSQTGNAHVGATAQQVTLGGVTTTYQGLASAANGTVSVGQAGKERQIQNVAAGDVTASSTDAVNGSQLYATNQAVNNIANGSTGVVQRTTTADVATMTAAGGDAANPGNAQKLTNLAAGTISSSSTDAVNGSQLYALGSSSAAVLGGNATYNTTTGQVTMTNVGGTGQDNVNDAIASVATTAGKGWNVTTGSTGTGTVSGTSVANVAPGATQTVTAGNNIAITQSGTDLTIATNPDLVSTSLTTGNSKLDTNGLTITGGPNGTVALTGSGLDNGGNKVLNVAAGTLSTTSTDAVNGSQLYALGSSSAAVLGGNATYNTTTGQVTMTNVGGTGQDNVNDAIASVATTAGKGWNLTAQGANSTNVAPGATVDLRNTDGNIEVTKTATDDTVSFNLSKNIAVDSLAAGNTVISNSGVAIGANVLLGSTGLTIVGGPSVTTSGINAGGLAITNVAAGVNATDAVNVSQLTQATTAASNKWVTGSQTTTYVAPSATGAESTAVGSGATASGNNSVAVGTGAVASASNSVALGNNATTTAATATTGTTINGTSYTFAGGAPVGVVSVGSAGAERQIQNVAAGQLSANSTDAVNGSQLYATNQAIQAVSAAANAGFNVTTAATGNGVAIGTSVSRVSPGSTVTYTAGNNMTLTQDGSNVTFAVSDRPTFSNVTVGNTNITSNGVSIQGGPSITTSGIDAGGQVVANVAPGVRGTDAVNVNQLNSGVAAGLAYTDAQANKLANAVNNVSKRAYAGTAAAMAMESAPYIAGKLTYSAGLGYYEGQSAVGATLRKTSDNGRWSVTGGVSATTTGTLAVRVGISGIID